MLSLIDTWIKASVEHRILNIDYFSASTKREETNRDIEPDFVGISKDERNSGFWATYCHLRDEGPRVFHENSIRRFSVTSEEFVPSPRGRWEELMPLYEEKGLKDKEFDEEPKKE